MHILSVLVLALASQAPQIDKTPAGPEKSAYFAFVARDFILTLEVVGPGVPLLNFVSMAEEPKVLAAKQVRIRIENRNVIARYFLVDTGDPKQPINTPSVNMRPRSSFGVRIQGELGEAREVDAVTIRIGEEDFKLVPLTSLAFENLVLKVNRINLESPDFRQDWDALKLEVLGTRERASRKQESGDGARASRRAIIF
jgi:hypothetical protein